MDKHGTKGDINDCGAAVDVVVDDQPVDAEALAQAFMKSTMVAIFSKDLAGRYTLVNGACENFWELTADQIVGRTDQDLLPECDAALLTTNDRRVIDEGKALEFEESMDFPGGRRTFLTCKIPLRDESGRVIGLCGVAADITARKFAEQAAQTSAERLKRMVRVKGIGALILDPMGSISFANDTFLEMLGYTTEEFANNALTWQMITPPQYLDVSEGQRRQARISGQIGPYDKEVIRKDGSLLWMRFAGVALDDRSIVKYCIDISDSKRTEAALRDSDQAKDEFLAVLGHELRNPLAPLSAGLDLLDQGHSNPDIYREIGPMMRRQLRHFTRLVDDLIDLSRIGQGKIELQLAVFDLNTSINAAIEQAQAMIAHCRHELQVNLSAAPLLVFGDAERLTALVTNLLRNAATFSSLGGKIVVCSKAADGHAVVRVRDNGFGIPTDRVNTVFEMFSQIPEHRERTGGGGLGIGLALSRQLVELHGGSIEATSRGLGHGSEFVVRLPMSEEKVVATDERQDAPEQLRRVLVVDDNTDACDTLGMVLELQGHTVQVAYDGPTALRSFESFRPDAVLLDLGLPRMHGYELARRIRALPGGESVLLVAITGWGQESDRQLSREAGIDEHLVKPVSSEQLSLLMS